MFLFTAENRIDCFSLLPLCLNCSILALTLLYGYVNAG
jgi:hypothetical protein